MSTKSPLFYWIMIAFLCALLFGSFLFAQARLQTATYRTHGPAVLNDLQATPGAVGTLPQTTLCDPNWHTGTVRNVPMSIKYQVCTAYGISRPNCNGRTYEIDHLISLELGGSNDPANLWPQPYFPKPAAKEKDVVENYLHRQVCSNKMTLSDAQKAISTDWYQVYLDVNAQQALLDRTLGADLLSHLLQVEEVNGGQVDGRAIVKVQQYPRLPVFWSRQLFRCVDVNDVVVVEGVAFNGEHPHCGYPLGAVQRGCAGKGFGSRKHLGAVVPDVPDELVRGCALHGLGLVGPEQMAGGRTRVVAVEPLIEVARMQDDRHPRVDLGHQLIGFGGDDRKGLEPLVGAGLPCVPQAGEGKGLAVAQRERKGLLVRLLPAIRCGGCQPLVEAIDRHQAAAALEGAAPRGGRQVFGLGVDRAEALERIQAFGEEGDQTPSHEHQLTLGSVAIQPDHRLKCTGRDVVVGDERELALLPGAKALGDLLLLRPSVVAPTHGGSLLRGESEGR